MKQGQVEFRRQNKCETVPVGNGMAQWSDVMTIEFRQWFDGEWSDWQVIDARTVPLTVYRK